MARPGENGNLPFDPAVEAALAKAAAARKTEIELRFDPTTRSVEIVGTPERLPTDLTPPQAASLTLMFAHMKQAVGQILMHEGMEQSKRAADGSSTSGATRYGLGRKLLQEGEEEEARLRAIQQGQRAAAGHQTPGIDI